MKLTSFAIIFVIIISPFIFISGQESETAIQEQRLRYYYDNAIDNAIQDARFILSNKGSGFAYTSDVNITDIKEICNPSIFNSIYHAFNVNGILFNGKS